MDGLEPLLKANVNGDEVSKHLEDGTKINYNRMLGLWDECVLCLFLYYKSPYRINSSLIRYEKRKPGISPYDIKSAKHFIEAVARGCKAGKEDLSMYTMMQKWIDFGARWKRRPGNIKIPHEVSETIYFVCARIFHTFPPL